VRSLSAPTRGLTHRERAGRAPASRRRTQVPGSATDLGQVRWPSAVAKCGGQVRWPSAGGQVWVAHWEGREVFATCLASWPPGACWRRRGRDAAGGRSDPCRSPWRATTPGHSLKLTGAPWPRAPLGARWRRGHGPVSIARVLGWQFADDQSRWAGAPVREARTFKLHAEGLWSRIDAPRRRACNAQGRLPRSPAAAGSAGLSIVASPARLVPGA